MYMPGRHKAQSFAAIVAALVLCAALLIGRATAIDGPPVAPVKPVTDDYFGTKIVDPYRWMEAAPNPALATWMKAQNDYTRKILSSLPGRAAWLAQLQSFARGTDVAGMQRAGSRTFFTLSKDGGTAKLYSRLGTADQLVFDPQAKVPAGSHGAIEFFTPSRDGKYVAVGTALNGAERETTIRVLATSTGRELPERLSRAWGVTPAWVGDKGFFYSRYPPPSAHANPTESEGRVRVFFHTLGTNAEMDKPVFGFGVVPHIRAGEQSFVYCAAGSPFAIGVVTNGVDVLGDVYVASLDTATKPGAHWRLIGKAFLDSDGGSVDMPGPVDIDLHGDMLYAVRFDARDRTQVVRVDLKSGGTLESPAVVIAPSQRVVRSVSAAADGLYVWSSAGGLSQLDRIDYATGTPRTVALPFSGTLLEPATDGSEPGAVFGLTSWTQPVQYFTYDPAGNSVAESGVRSTTFADTSSLTTEDVLVTSPDGTQVPLSIVHAKGIALDGSHPTELIGYGAYGASPLDPGFDTSFLPWLSHDGIIAFAHVRGGGEFGEPWHLAGKGANKQHTIDDFIACAQYLIDKGYASRAKLAGWGTSAGGIVIGNAIVQRPDLFAVAVISHGFTDMLRYERTPNGPPNVPEFGSVRTEQGFAQLYAMSAYNHVVDGTAYPAVFLSTGANDARVSPWIVAKMAARLQAATSSGKPVLLSVDYNSGHGIDSTRESADESLADTESFILWQTGDRR